MCFPGVKCLIYITTWISWSFTDFTCTKNHRFVFLLFEIEIVLRFSIALKLYINFYRQGMAPWVRYLSLRYLQTFSNKPSLLRLVLGNLLCISRRIHWYRIGVRRLIIHSSDVIGYEVFSFESSYHFKNSNLKPAIPQSFLIFNPLLIWSLTLEPIRH